jgi:geranylgeranyl pyrophosphate synthase
MSISNWLPTYHAHVEQSIASFFAERYASSTWVEQRYEGALRYAVEWGGKRLRPILAMVAYEYSRWVQVGFWDTEEGKKLLTALIGIEFMHCYTLVHDDLPCMDNDEFRRGKPTVWKQYGEDMALLVWDTLQTMSFELLSTTGSASAVWVLARALGDFGVARGQVRDTFLRHDELSLEELLRIHDEKTGIFISACLTIATILWGGSNRVQQRMWELGKLLGRAFQVQDDILDAEGTLDTVGKKTGKDASLGKGIVSLIGLSEAKRLLCRLEEEMFVITWGLEDPRFADIVAFVVHRQH